MPRIVPPRPVRWPRLLMVVCGLIFLIVTFIAFQAMSNNDFVTAFPMFIVTLILIVLEVFLFVLNIRLNS